MEVFSEDFDGLLGLADAAGCRDEDEVGGEGAFREELVDQALASAEADAAAVFKSACDGGRSRSRGVGAPVCACDEHEELLMAGRLVPGGSRHFEGVLSVELRSVIVLKVKTQEFCEQDVCAEESW